MRRRITIVVYLLIITTMLSSCTINKSININNYVTKNQEPGWQKDTSPITFKWFINFPWFENKWGKDVTSKYVTEKTGVSIDFITPPNDTSDNLKALIAADELPDFITIGHWDQAYDLLINNDSVWALNELADSYDIYFNKVVDKQKLEWYKREDGNIYCYPNYSYTLEDEKLYKDKKTSNQTFLVRKDIYEAIGSPDMRTPEGFIRALMDAKEMFDGKESYPLIPIGLHNFTEDGNYSLEAYLQNFLAIPYEKDGQLYDRFSDPEYIRWLKTFRKANELGLISKEVFFDKGLQIEEKIGRGQYFALLFQSSDMVNAQMNLYNDNPDKIYMAVDGPANTALDEPKLAVDGIGGWTVTLISKNCKDPKRAIRFLSYLISEEGNKDLYLGEKGVTWESIDGEDKLKSEVAELLNKDKYSFEKIYGAVDTYWMLADDNMSLKWKGEEIEPIKLLNDWSIGKTENYSLYSNLWLYGHDELGVPFENLNKLWGKTLFRLIRAESDEEFDKIFSEFQRKRIEEGYLEVRKEQQRIYENNKVKLGIEQEGEGNYED